MFASMGKTKFRGDVVERKDEESVRGELMMGLDAGTRVAGYCHEEQHGGGARELVLKCVPKTYPKPLCSVPHFSS